MEAESVELPLVSVVGPTASGKTSLAIEVAKQYNGEIICADSRTIYKGMDIGTAKPTIAEQKKVRHWGLDLIEPDQRFTAADFKQYANKKIDEIRSRGHIPFIVGGTGLYVDAVLFDYQFQGKVDDTLRNTLSGLSVDELQEYCIKNNIVMPENNKNKRYLIRAIEMNGASASRSHLPRSNSIIVGITTEKNVLEMRIAARTEQLFENGVVDEATLLGKKYGWGSEAMTGNIYPLVHLYLKGEISLEEMKAKSTTLDWRLAKRQLTWFRRNAFIYWGTIAEVRAYLTDTLAKRT